jgi:DNA damage-binding protein 1
VTGGTLVYLEVAEGGATPELKEVATKKMGNEIACLSASLLDASGEKSTVVAVGMWTDVSVR